MQPQRLSPVPPGLARWRLSPLSWISLLRPYVPADLEPLIDCWYDTWHHTFAPRRHPHPRSAFRERFLRQYAQEAEVWVARDLRAFLILFSSQPETSLTGTSNSAGWIEQLFVAPPAQNHGLGRALIALARFRCPQGLALDTPAENLPARRFYSRRGFAAQQIGFDAINQRLVLRYVWPAPRT